MRKCEKSPFAAGVFCAIVSHPADSVVSVLNKEKGSTALEVAKKLGWKGCWSGLFPRIIMIGTLTALQVRSFALFFSG